MPNNDFNGDGLSDLLWRRDDGLLTTWFSTGDSFAVNTAFSQLVSVDWTVAGTGDFDSDGRGDVLWRKSDGQLTTWLSNGATFDAGFNQMVDLSWRVETVGDFNRDGLSDIFWRRDDGLVTTWLGNGNGGFVDAVDPVGFVAPEWSVVGTGDFDADGDDDVLWQKTNLQLTVWTSDGEVPVANDAWNQFPEVFRYPHLPSGYSMVPGRFSEDDRDDVLLTYDDLPSKLAGGASTQTSYVGLSEDTNFIRGASTPTELARYIGQDTVGDYNGDGTDDIARIFGFNGPHELRVTLVDGAPATGDDWSAGLMFSSSVPIDWLLITM